MYEKAWDVESSQAARRNRVAASPGLGWYGVVADQSGCAPDVWIVSLIPIDVALPAGDTRNSRPASSEADIMLAVEEVGSISWVESHGFEPIVSSQRRARPFPETSSVALAAQRIFMSDCSGMPIVESDIPTVKVDEEV